MPPGTTLAAGVHGEPGGLTIDSTGVTHSRGTFAAADALPRY